METVRIRELAAGDSLGALTHLLHQAYARWGEAGLDFNGVGQPEAATAARVRQGVCLVAENEGELVGTLLVHGPLREAPSSYLRRGDAACVQQFAVRPDWQRLGVGSTLLALAERCAGEAGYRQVVLDTAVVATELVGWYGRRGYVAVDAMQWPSKSYVSLVLAKNIHP
jgi:GNAT superfamily N-acetyltransferase